MIWEKVFDLFYENIEKIICKHYSFSSDYGACTWYVYKLKLNGKKYKMVADEGGMNIHSYVSVRKGFHSAKAYVGEFVNGRQDLDTIVNPIRKFHKQYLCYLEAKNHQTNLTKLRSLLGD